MSGLDEQYSEYPDCPECVEGHFWIGKIETDGSLISFKYIYFNTESYMGKGRNLKKVTIYDVPRGEHGRYATKEEIEASYEIFCASCKALAVEHLVSIIKKVAINHIGGIGH